MRAPAFRCVALRADWPFLHVVRRLFEGIMNKLIKRFLREDRGVTAIEYALIAGLMAAAVATAITGVTGKITAVFTAVVNSM